WLHHKDCLTCFTCYHHCPHHAIEFGKQTRKKGQYFFK
ncbi:MAG: ferredoxin, partial [Segatella copri]